MSSRAKGIPSPQYRGHDRRYAPDMIVCPSCGVEAPEGQKFCGECGTVIGRACPSCGAEHSPGQRFCGECGAPLEAATPATPSARRVSAERRIVSVLFIDLVGFTSFSEKRDPEEVRTLISDYFDLARQVIDRFGGTVDKYIGDAVMAWWGATASQEDDAERAVRAGLEIVDRVTSLGEKIGVVDLAARAGVMTGETSVGPGGNEKGLLLGDIVNSASRLQGLAEPGTVLVGPNTATLVGDAIELIDAGTHTVKGKEEPVAASLAVRMVGERGGRGRSDSLEPPFVGRASELRLLKDTLHAAGTDGRARLVSLVGQAGVGKSRLAWEFRKYTDGLVENVYWHEGRSPSYGDGIALWALGEMIRNRARIHETDDEETTLRLLAESIADHVDEPTEGDWILDRLAALLGVGEATGERSELFSAARAYFERISRKGTAVLVFEDLHWADPSLLEFIEELPDWSQNHPIVIVTMARPDLLERRPDWGSGRRGFTSLYVGPLTDEEMTDMIEGAVPGIPRTTTARIVESSGGIPLFGVEMIRMLMGDGRLDADRPNADRAPDLEIPSSVQSVISARLDRLPPDDREAARDAAVLGYSFTAAGLAAVRDETVDKVERRLTDLVRREVLELVRDPMSPERGQYRWVQSLLREVAYSRIGRAHRSDLHLRAARYFRDLNDPELAPVAAAHYVTATELTPETSQEIQSELVESLHGAIGRAQAVHGYEQILSLVETALPVVPPDAEFELREMAALAAVNLQDFETADRHVEALGDLARAADDVTLVHRAVAARGQVANDTRRSESARQLLEDHLVAHPDLKSDPNLTRVAVYLARTRMLSGLEDQGAAELADEALAAAESFDLTDAIADALITRGTALVSTRPRQGMALLRGALRLCREHDLTATGLRALINIGYGSPDIQESIEATRMAVEEAKRVGDKGHARFALGNLISFLIEGLELAELDQILEDPILADVPASEALTLAVTRADMALCRGDRQEAEDQLEVARGLVGSVSDVQVLAYIGQLEGMISLLEGDYETVFTMFRNRYRDVTFSPWLSAYYANQGAAMAGRRDWLEEMARITSELPGGVVTRALGKWVDALILLTDGDEAAAVALAEEAANEMNQQGFDRMEMFCLASLASHLPQTHPERERLASAARAIASKAGAEGLVDWISRVVPALETSA